jgi:Uma2 family endonuclease
MSTLTREKLFSFEEYCNYENDSDNRYELIDGKLQLMTSPSFRHLLIAKFIEKVIDDEIKRLNLPWLTFKEAGVRTGLRKSRLADIYVIKIDQVTEFIDQTAICQTPPLLIVEIVSPDSIKRDYRHKRSEYAALEVPEYWIIDPLTNQIFVLLLEDGLYEETIFINQEKIISKTFPELSLTVEQVLNSSNL